MSSGTKRPLAEMQAVAKQLVIELAPYCERLEVAGSLRRGAAEVGDIEIVCVPRIEQQKGDDLFRPEPVNLLDTYVRSRPTRFKHRLDKHNRRSFGTRFKRLVVDGVPLDLFSVLPPAQWGVVFLIRTGPAEFSRRMVTSRHQGGALPSHLTVRGGAIWHGEELVPCDTEADWFRLCDMEYVRPEERR